MKGCWNKPEETAKVIIDGWLHIGDVGHADEDGDYWITDRKKDLIVKDGENISLRSVEEALCVSQNRRCVGDSYERRCLRRKHQGIRRDETGPETTAEDIHEQCKTKLTHFFLPEEIVLLPALPKNLVGKILKKRIA